MTNDSTPRVFVGIGFADDAHYEYREFKSQHRVK